jgi:hypothetical protein
MTNKDSIDQDPLEKLLADGLLSPSDDFADKVMQRIEREAPYDYRQSSRVNSSVSESSIKNTSGPDRSGSALWQLVALVASTVVGASQVIGFIFGLWIPATVG